MSYLIAAVDNNMGLGINNTIPWRDTNDGNKDMAFFRKQTKGHAVLMGYKTWQSIGKPLPGRVNIVVSRTNYECLKMYEKSYKGPVGTSIVVFNNLTEALNFALKYEKDTQNRCYICGGGEIYRQYLQIFIPKTIYITKLRENYNCDVLFPLNEFETYINHLNCITSIEDEIFYSYCRVDGGKFIESV